MLGAAIADELVRRFPDSPEGVLARMKAYAVSREACALVATRLDLGRRLVETGAAVPGVDPGSAAVLATNRRVLAALCEAAIGAAFLEAGWEATRAAVVAAFDDRIAFAERDHVDPKTVLQELLQSGVWPPGAAEGGRRQAPSVEYEAVSATGPPHDRRFVSAVLVDGVEAGRGEGTSKRRAEQEAARAALERLGALPPAVDA